MFPAIPYGLMLPAIPYGFSSLAMYFLLYYSCRLPKDPSVACGNWGKAKAKKGIYNTYIICS
jgi:hypothetical protein